MRSLSLILVMSLLAAACGDETPTGPSPFPASVTLQPGEQSNTGGLVVLFEGVTEDSRCPLDALCIQAGDATARVTLTTGGVGTPFFLTVNKVETKRATFREFQVELVTLQPYPQSRTPIAPSAYRATFTITQP
jgi:hypothetical protein